MNNATTDLMTTQRVDRLMRKTKTTNTEMAFACQLSQGTISLKRAGRRRWRTSELIVAANLFASKGFPVSIDYLVGRSDSMLPGLKENAPFQVGA